MEAPKKIYIDDFGPELSFDWHTEHSYEKDIEYVRKDVFIEKACEYWYQYNRNIVKNHGTKAVLGCNEFTVNVEDFKNYLKGV